MSSSTRMTQSFVAGFDLTKLAPHAVRVRGLWRYRGHRTRDWVGVAVTVAVFAYVAWHLIPHLL